MTISVWQVIRDDSKRTFEVCGKTNNDNAFTNRTHAMQKAGMNVSCMTPPVTNKTASKDFIKIVGYTQEDGLHDRLSKEFMKLTLKGYEGLNEFEND
jgi:hypothetical protein